MALGIPGIDEKAFDDLLDCDEELFATLVTSFVGKTPSVLSKLAVVSEETLADYAKIVHGLKGACANVCAEEAKNMALSLERKSRAGDLAGVQAENGPFLKHVEELTVNLRNWLEKHK